MIYSPEIILDLLSPVILSGKIKPLRRTCPASLVNSAYSKVSLGIHVHVSFNFDIRLLSDRYPCAEQDKRGVDYISVSQISIDHKAGDVIRLVLSIHLSVCPSVRPSVCLSVCLSVCSSVRLSVSPSVSQCSPARTV